MNIPEGMTRERAAHEAALAKQRVKDMDELIDMCNRDEGFPNLLPILNQSLDELKRREREAYQMLGSVEVEILRTIVSQARDLNG